MFGHKDKDKKEPDAVAADQAQEKPPLEPAEEIAKLTNELAESRDKYFRLFAEFDNVRKRNDRDRLELIKYAHEEVIVDLLGFFEDFERCILAAKASPNDGVGLLKGVEMIYGRMQQLLKKYDVREIEAAGKKFDHNYHEALLAVDSTDHEDGTVLEVFQKGYTLGGRVVRTAKVKVAKAPAADIVEPGESPEQAPGQAEV